MILTDVTRIYGSKLLSVNFLVVVTATFFSFMTKIMFFIFLIRYRFQNFIDFREIDILSNSCAFF